MTTKKSDLGVPKVLPAYKYRAYCERVIDGDTYWIRVDLGFHVGITIPVRLLGVDTPELGTQEGLAAKEWVTRILRPANLRWDEDPDEPTHLVIESYRDRQSFARWIASVYIADTGESLAALLLDSGHAVPMER